MRVTTKTTFVYALIDPRSQCVRYVGKTVLPPERRLVTHIWRAAKEPHKRHSMAWLIGLTADHLKAEIVVLEEVPPGGDWVEAEQFWIGYLRMLGADLCNHTIGGEGVPGYRQPPELVARRIRRGSAHHSFGKPKAPEHMAALQAGRARMFADPVRREQFEERRRAGITPEGRERSIAALKIAAADPIKLAARAEKHLVAVRRPEVRAAVGEKSRQRWSEHRAEIIAAQNAGKGSEYRRRQSENKRREWEKPNNPHRAAAKARRRFSEDDLVKFRRMLEDGMPQSRIAAAFGITQSMVSLIKSGKRL